MHIRKWLKIEVFILVVLCSFGCDTISEVDTPVTFELCATAPAARASATAFAAGEYGYVCCGRGADGKHLNDVWQYNARANSWTQLTDAPFTPRVKAIAQVVDNKAFIGLGYNGSHAYNESYYLRDWWCFDTETHTWTQLADFPVKDTSGATSCVCDGIIYVCFGFFDHFGKTIYAYNPQDDTWTTCGEVKTKGRFAAAMCGDERYIFVGSGYRTVDLNDWWRFEPQQNRWTPCANMQGARSLAAAIAASHRYYLLGGRHFGGSLTDGHLYDDLLEYNPDKDQWLLLGHLPNGARENAITLCIDGKPYFGFGENSAGEILNDFYTWHD